MTNGGEHDQAAELLLAKVRALRPSEREQRQALFDEASVHGGFAQVAATLEGHLRASALREEAWLQGLGDP